MQPIHRLALISIAVIAFASSAFADCPAAAPRDRCLFGTWKMTVNGAEEWMRQNIHSAHVAGVAATNNTITIMPDGTFWTGTSRINAHVAADEGHMEGEGQMNATSRGRWAASGGILKMCPTATTTSGSVTVHDASGFSTTVPMPHIAARDSSLSYHCSGNTFTTTMPMPHATTVTSTYVRMH